MSFSVNSIDINKYPELIGTISIRKPNERRGDE